MNTEDYLKNLLQRIVNECENCGVSAVYENLEGNTYRRDFPTELGKLLGEARLAADDKFLK